MRVRDNSGSKFRFIGHSLILAVCYFLQITPGVMPEILGTLPMLVIAVVVCIAMFEKDLAGTLFGLAGGLLLDLNSLQAPGFNAMLLMVIGCASGLMVSNLMKNTLSTALLLTGGAALAYNIIYWAVFYLFKGVERAGYYFIRYEIIDVVYTMVLAIPVYLIIRRFMKSLKS